MKYEYLLAHKYNKVYLRYMKDIKFKHYVANAKDASIFTLTQAKRMLKTFKHPENWIILRRKKTGLFKNIKKKRGINDVYK